MMKKYILKPGNHQFAPGSAAVHNNENTSDESAAWYLEKYPHIAALFESVPAPEATEKASPKTKDQPKQATAADQTADAPTEK